MNKRSFVGSFAAVAACLGASVVVTGCAPEEVTGETSQPILNGVATNLRPEVGQFFHRGSMCTATLVAPRYAVTASHCLNVNNFADTSLPGGSILRLTDTPVGVRDFAVDRVFGYGRAIGEMTPAGWLNTDVALVRLQTAVPSNVALPAAMQTWYPATGQYSTVFGYGCTRERALVPLALRERQPLRGLHVRPGGRRSTIDHRVSVLRARERGDSATVGRGLRASNVHSPSRSACSTRSSKRGSSAGALARSHARHRERSMPALRSSTTSFASFSRGDFSLR